MTVLLAVIIIDLKFISKKLLLKPADLFKAFEFGGKSDLKNLTQLTKQKFLSFVSMRLRPVNTKTLYLQPF